MRGQLSSDPPHQLRLLQNWGQGRWEGNSSLSELQFTSAKHEKNNTKHNFGENQTQAPWLSQVFQSCRTHLSNTKIDFGFKATLGREKRKPTQTHTNCNHCLVRGVYPTSGEQIRNAVVGLQPLMKVLTWQTQQVSEILWGFIDKTQFEWVPWFM